ncbi:hypothetical protein D9M73_167700 [compost metagenome]
MQHATKTIKGQQSLRQPVVFGRAFEGRTGRVGVDLLRGFLQAPNRAVTTAANQNQVIDGGGQHRGIGRRNVTGGTDNGSGLLAKCQTLLYTALLDGFEPHADGQGVAGRQRHVGNLQRLTIVGDDRGVHPEAGDAAAIGAGIGDTPADFFANAVQVTAADVLGHGIRIHAQRV